LNHCHLLSLPEKYIYMYQELLWQGIIFISIYQELLWQGIFFISIYQELLWQGIFFISMYQELLWQGIFFISNCWNITKLVYIDVTTINVVNGDDLQLNK